MINFKGIKTVALATIMLVVLMLLAGCGGNTENATTATFVNESETALTNITFVSGADTVEIGDIASGESVSKEVVFYNAEGVNIKYTTNGFCYDSRIPTDFDGKFKNATSVKFVYGKDNNGIYVFTCEATSSVLSNTVLWIIILAVLIVAGVLLVIMFTKKRKN